MSTMVLRGGPGGVERVLEMPGAEIPQQVTVDYYGRHVHFEKTSDVEIVEGREMPVFHWSYTTMIAE